MTQGEIEKLTKNIERIFGRLEESVMDDIVRRIQINGFSTASADWQISRLRQLGESEETIKKYVQEALSVTDAEIKRIFDDEVSAQYYGFARTYQVNGFEQIKLEDNAQLQQLLEATKAQLSKQFGNLADSMGFAIKNQDGTLQNVPLLEFYRKTLDDAVIGISSGSFSYNTMLQRAINTMTASGLRWVDYESGWHNRVPVAARRAVMTGFRQVQAQINEQVAKDLNTDSYEVSWHGGARPAHQIWQGKVYTKQELVDVCGLGSVTGLCGANCYHDYNAFIPGVSVRTYTDEWLDQMNAEENTPKDYNGKKYTTYEALQRQRQLETAARKYREDIRLLKLGGADPDTIMHKSAKYSGILQEYADFSDKMGLPMQKERIWMDGLTARKPNQSTVYMGVPKTWIKKDNIDVSGKVNPLNYDDNCVICCIAYEMRERGYLVYAGPKVNKLAYRDPFAGWENPDPIIIDNGFEALDKIKAQMKEWGDGTRAQVTVTWNLKKTRLGVTINNDKPPGHSFIAKQENGNTIFIDIQHNELYDDSIFLRCNTFPVMFARLNDLSINDLGVSTLRKE